MSDYDKPNALDPYHAMMADVWQKVADATTGLPALANSTYLPQHPLEHNAIHEQRLKNADFLPFFDDTVLSCVGLIFRDEPTLGDDVPEFIAGVEEDAEKGIAEKEGLWENLDNAGTHGNVFLSNCADTAIRYGHCVILVENMPALGPNASLAQERASGRRPYCVQYMPEQVRNPFFTIERGRLVLEQITFVETVKERAGRYGQKDVRQYRTFIRENVDGSARVRWIIEREVTDKNDKGTGEFYTYDEGETGLDEIPVAVIYGNETGNLQSRPVFENLLYLNLSHFRKLSNYNYAISRLQWALLVGTGIDDVKSIVPRKDGVIAVPAGCDAKYIAPPADGANVATADLERLEKTMTAFGLRILLSETGGNTTATEVEMEHSSRTSKLSTIVKSVKDAAERILYFLSLYNARPGETVTSGGSITIGGDVDDLTLTTQELDVILRAVESGNFPRSTWLQVAASMVRKQVPGFNPMAADKELQGIEESASNEVMNGTTEETQAARQGASNSQD